jgi:hypothetical protein
MTPCPECGEPAEPGQLVCVNCGARLALRQRPPYLGPPRSALPALVLLLAVVVIGAGAFGFALSEITRDDDADGGQVRAAGTVPPAPSASAGKPQTATRATERPGRTPLLQWPDGVTGYTVVLVTTGDHAAARRVAFEAARSGLEAGLLRSDQYDLGSGLWLVFAGRFDSREGAGRDAAALDRRFPGAYVQLVRPAQG